MKQNTDEPDYRSMNEVQLKYELIKLEKKILDITGDPIDYKHNCPFLGWCRDEAKVDAVEEMMLDRSLVLSLLFYIYCTLVIDRTLLQAGRVSAGANGAEWGCVGGL